MKRIGGNVTATLQQKGNSTTFDAIGERVNVWTDVATLRGWLDLASNNGTNGGYTYNAKLQDTSHVFLCDYAPIDRSMENKRMVINGMRYDVLLIDDPMELHQHLEVYLQFIGAVI